MRAQSTFTFMNESFIWFNFMFVQRLPRIVSIDTQKYPIWKDILFKNIILGILPGS